MLRPPLLLRLIIKVPNQPRSPFGRPDDGFTVVLSKILHTWFNIVLKKVMANKSCRFSSIFCGKNTYLINGKWGFTQLHSHKKQMFQSAKVYFIATLCQRYDRQASNNRKTLTG